MKTVDQTAQRNPKKALHWCGTWRQGSSVATRSFSPLFWTPKKTQKLSKDTFTLKVLISHQVLLNIAHHGVFFVSSLSPAQNDCRRSNGFSDCCGSRFLIPSSSGVHHLAVGSARRAGRQFVPPMPPQFFFFAP